MMSCLKTALKEWMNHVKRNASLMTPCALNSTRNSWRNMLNNCLVIELYFSNLFKKKFFIANIISAHFVFLIFMCCPSVVGL